MATPRTPKKKRETSETIAGDATLSGQAAADAETTLPDATGAIAQVDLPEDSLDVEAAPVEAEVIGDMSNVEDRSVVLPDPTDNNAPEEVAPEIASDTGPEPVRTNSPAAPARNSGGFFGPLVGGVIAAGIGFAVAQYGLPRPPVTDTVPLQSQLAEQAALIADLQAQIEILPEPPVVDGLDAITTEIASLREQILATSNGEIADRITTIEARLSELEQRPAGGEAGIADMTALQAQVTALQDAMNAQSAGAIDLAAEAAAARSALEAAQAEATAQLAETEAAATAAVAEAVTARLAAAAAQIGTALQSGEPYADAVAALTADGVEVPAVLAASAEAGVPTLNSLISGFGEPARAALSAGLRETMGDSVTERITAFMRSQTGARSLTPQEGSDPDAILSRAEAAVRLGDLTTSLAEIGGMTEPAQAEMADWVTRVQTRLAATEAYTALSAALGER